MTQTEQGEALWAAMLAEPEDWSRRLVLADLLEEGGEAERAAALRYMAMQKKRPCVQRDGRGVWFNLDRGPPECDPESDIPSTIWDVMTGDSMGASMKRYASSQLAEEDFLAAFVLAVKGGWDPKQ